VGKSAMVLGKCSPFWGLELVAFDQDLVCDDSLVYIVHVLLPFLRQKRACHIFEPSNYQRPCFRQHRPSIVQWSGPNWYNVSFSRGLIVPLSSRVHLRVRLAGALWAMKKLAMPVSTASRSGSSFSLCGYQIPSSRLRLSFPFQTQAKS
jgi:hypothetical protein